MSFIFNSIKMFIIGTEHKMCNKFWFFDKSRNYIFYIPCCTSFTN